MKVAVYFATGYEEIEALSVVDVLRRAGVDVKMVGVTGRTVLSGRQISLNMDAIIEEINPNEVDMIVLPGGVPGVDHLMENDLLVHQLKSFKEQDKYIAAICAAPSILGKLGLLKGEKATCYPGYEEFLEGCQVVDERVVVSNHIITGKGAGASLEFALAILEVIEGKEAAQKIAQGMLVQ